MSNLSPEQFGDDVPPFSRGPQPGAHDYRQVPLDPSFGANEPEPEEPKLEGSAVITIDGIGVMDMLAEMLAVLSTIEERFGLTADQGASLDVKDGTVSLKVQWSVSA